MRPGRGIIGLLAALLTIAAGCATPVSQWRDEARMTVSQVRDGDAGRFFPSELRDLEFTLRQGDQLFADSKVAKADEYYLLAVTKGRLIDQALAAERQRQEEARLRAEAERRAEMRRRELAEQAEQARLAREREDAAARLRAEAEQAAQAEARRKQERARQLREKPLPTHHTVKRGETLPQIAAQSDIYNDASLWPLIYRANRDQIRDPRVLWPGQILRIPRNASRDDLAEARRYSQEKPLR